MTDTTGDKYLGQVFEDRDWRMDGRRIKVLSRFEKEDPWGVKYPAYRVETVAAPNAPTSVGNKSSIGEKQLEKRYRKVED